MESVTEKYNLKESDFKIIFPSTAKEVFTQKHPYIFSKQKHLIFVFKDMNESIIAKNFICKNTIQTYSKNFRLNNLFSYDENWQFGRRYNKSYSLKENMQNLEEPNYTRPENVKGFSVPNILLNGDSIKITKWRRDISVSL